MHGELENVEYIGNL